MKRILEIGLIALMFLALGTISCADAKGRSYRLEVVKGYPHDPLSYTQGLFFLSGELIETTGEFGESTLRKVELQTGKTLRRLDFDRKYFIEGSVALNGNIYILTWTNKVAFVYDAATWEYKATWRYPREGWGLTTDGKSLIASDGSANLYFLDENFQQQKALTVKLNDRPVRNLNELEWIDGKIWANVYMSDLIVIINPMNGIVEGTVDCTGLLPQNLRNEYTDVLNGIAYNPETRKIYLTGKYWKRLYEVKLVEKSGK